MSDITEVKKVALMQTYLFPYLGYFQLIHAVDLFIAYDDVQWMKGGWINRNRILINGQPEYITLPVKKDDFTKNINERVFRDEFEADKEAILETLRNVYAHAPYFKEGMTVVERCFGFDGSNAADFIINSLKVCCDYMGVTTEIIRSSEINGKTEGLRGQDRVIDIVSKVGATWYINAIGGQELYSKDEFQKHGINLSFIKSHLEEYKQLGGGFVPGLSIIDVIMFNSKEKVNEHLNNYELI